MYIQFKIPPASLFGNLSRSYGMTGLFFSLRILFPPERDKVSCLNSLSTDDLTEPGTALIFTD